MTLELGYACSVGAIGSVLSMLGFALFYNNLLSGDFDRSRFYRRCTGKQIWDDEKIRGKGRTTKDEDRAGLLPPSEMPPVGLAHW